MAKRKLSGPSNRKSAKSTRRDGVWVNTQSGHGTSRDSRTVTDFSVTAVNDIQGIQLWRNDPLLKRIVELLPREAMRRDFTVKVSGSDGSENDGDKEVSEAIMDECERLEVGQRVMHAAQMERAAGGCGMFPVIDGAVGELDEPLDEYEDNITRIEALHTLEPRELYPQRWYTQLTDPKFRHPSVYRLQPLSGATGRPMAPVWIHESRMIIFPGTRVTQQYQPGQRVGWGDNIVSACFQVAADYGIAWSSVSTLLQTFASGVFKLHDLAAILATKNGEAELDKRVAAMQQYMSTLKAAIIDKDDEFTRQQTPVSGLDSLLVQMAQFVAMVADAPLTILMGMSPAGLNATGEADTRGWYDRVEAARKRYRKMIMQIVRLIMLQSTGPTNGKIPDKWSVEFPPLWQPTEQEQAQIRYTIAQTDKIYAVDIGAVSGTTIAESRWKGGSFSPEMHIDWDAMEAQQKLDQELQAAQLAAAERQAMGYPADPTAGEDMSDADTSATPGPGEKPPIPSKEPNESDPSRAPAPTNGVRKVPVVAHQRTVRGDEWSDAAREAAAEARKRGGANKRKVGDHMFHGTTPGGVDDHGHQIVAGSGAAKPSAAANESANLHNTAWKATHAADAATRAVDVKHGAAKATETHTAAAKAHRAAESAHLAAGNVAAAADHAKTAAQHERAAGHTPGNIDDSGMRHDEWSDAAREAAAEARKHGGGANKRKAGDKVFVYGQGNTTVHHVEGEMVHVHATVDEHGRQAPVGTIRAFHHTAVHDQKVAPTTSPAAGHMFHGTTPGGVDDSGRRI